MTPLSKTQTLGKPCSFETKNPQQLVLQNYINAEYTNPDPTELSVKMYQEILNACYFGQMKDYNYEEMIFSSEPTWSNYEYHELLYYLRY